MNFVPSQHFEECIHIAAMAHLVYQFGFWKVCLILFVIELAMFAFNNWGYIKEQYDNGIRT